MAASATLSSVQLQSHYDEVLSQMSVLPLSILPRPIANSLAPHNLDPAAAKHAKKASAGLTECQVCSCSSQPEQLQLLISTKLDFHTRAVHPAAARFVCAQCAAVSCCSTVLQLLTPPVRGEEDEQRSEQLHQLLLHFAAINNAPASITSNPDSLALWTQELACRAYSLSIVANSLRGWTLQPAGASMLQIMQQLLKQKSKAAAAGVDAGVPSAGKHKKQNSKQQPGQQQQQQEGGTPKGPGSKRLGSGDAAVEVPTTHSKKQKRAAARAEQAQLPTAIKKQEQQQGSAKKRKLGAPKAQAAPVALRTPQQAQEQQEAQTAEDSTTLA